MTTYQLIAALGCGGAGACAPAADLCGQGTCLASITAADFSRAPKLPGEVNPAGGTVIALADQDAPSATAVSCTQEGAGWVLKGEGGAVIGQPVDSAEHCQSLAKTARRKLVCGWSGTAISPFRKSGGPAFGMAGSGAKSIAACAEMVAASSEEVACAWTGQAIALFSLDKPGRAIGGAEQSPDVELCAAKAKTAFQGRVCSWDGKGISIFNAKSGAAEGDLGSFDSYEACGGIVRETATAQKRVEYVALKAKIAVPNNVAIAPPPGQQESSESLNLAGGGWTWGSCNDRDRHYTLVRTSGGKMVCEGKIDTLYSWGPAAKVLWLADQKWSGRLRRDGKNSPVFSTQSSFATFGYGDVAIRFRLRSGVKFKFFDGTDAYSVCDDVNLLEIDDTVAVRFWNTTSYSGVDYILCSLGPVHSWSYGTQRHYDELNREVLWMNANNYMNYELYVKVNGVDTIFPDNLDGHRFTTQHWQSKQGSHVQLLPGRIYYNPEAQSKKESVHFSSDWSNYINP